MQAFRKMLLALIGVSMAVISVSAQSSHGVKVIARGGGKTIIQGGTGQAGGKRDVLAVLTMSGFRAG